MKDDNNHFKFNLEEQEIPDRSQHKQKKKPAQ